ncbi:hypothetical protein HOK51_08370 [Candidatus Woesearchaeota archaeon]|jgi:hypothetical protein|nr:hypothetical protein [Candidatus Woesearchaeota archaeon]MBT6519840.1 hypothetical protein [Candidatus Woesearchaeota archaeon]MBT7366887.1 hypothetical protein [Candidatus Woesearchaeota archaeon]
MITKKALKNLELFANDIYPEFAIQYRKYSGVRFQDPDKIQVKDCVGFLEDCITYKLENNLKFKNNPFLKLFSEAVFGGYRSATKDHKVCDFREQKAALLQSAYSIVMDDDQREKFDNAESFEDAQSVLDSSPQIKTLDAWLELFEDARAAFPTLLDDNVSIANSVFHTDPVMSDNSIYVINWGGVLVEEEKEDMGDDIKMFLGHECSHLLNEKVGKLHSKKTDPNLSKESRADYGMLDEGFAFFGGLRSTLNKQSSKYSLPVALGARRVCSVVKSIADKTLGLLPKYKKSENKYKQNIQMYDFIMHVALNHGLEEVYKLVANPEHLTKQEIANPKLYSKRFN